MTRKEQIAKAASSRVSLIAQNGFKIGARWADEHPKSPWVRPNERMPLEDESVLVHLKDGRTKLGGWMKDDLDDEVYWWGFEEFIETKDVDYWMPIPKLPNLNEE